MRLLHFRRALLPYAVALATAGCDSSLAPDATFDMPIVSVDVSTVAPGAIVDMRAENRSSADWHFNPCSSPRLQRREGDTWVTAPEPLVLCSTEVETLDGGQTLEIGVAVPSGYEPGTYRIMFRVARTDGVEARPTTNSFTVE